MPKCKVGISGGIDALRVDDVARVEQKSVAHAGASGQVERPSHGKDHCVATYPVRVEDGIVLIGLPMVSRAGAAA